MLLGKADPHLSPLPLLATLGFPSPLQAGTHLVCTLSKGPASTKPNFLNLPPLLVAWHPTALEALAAQVPSDGLHIDMTALPLGGSLLEE